MAKKPFLLVTTAASLPALASSYLPLFHSVSAAFVADSRRSYTAGSVSTTLSSATPPGKGDFYDDDELFDLLTLHNALNAEEDKGLFSGDFNGDDDNGSLNEESLTTGGIHEWVLQTLNEEEDAANINSNPTNGGDYPAEASAIPGLHELVLGAIDDINSSASPSKDDDKGDTISPTFNQLAYNNLQTLLRDKKPAIRAIATDVDGTLLSGQYLHPITRDAVLKAIRSCQSSSTTESAEQTPSKIAHFFPATGKSRRGAELSLGPVVGPLLYHCPGVYIQGLYCVDREGNVVFEKKLPAAAVRAAEALVEEFGISIVGYDGDDLYTTDRTEVVASLSEVYGEPTVKLIAKEGGDKSTINLAGYDRGMHKLLLMDEDLEKLAVVRPRLEDLASRTGATVTQALPTMLELLPEGCSKGHGVNKLCEALGINASEELLALGDAENDADMLEGAAIGVAVGNACPTARDAADFIMRERHEEGAAGLAMELFGFDA